MRRCVFLDRDGVINVKPAAGEYIRTHAEFQLIETVADWIRLFNALDLLVIVVTNQRGVALGLMSIEDLESIHRKMRDDLAARGARLDDIYCCVHDEGACDCRKPRPGMVRAAAAKWQIDIGRSLMIGDSVSDRELAEVCGMRFVNVESGHVTAVVIDASVD
jgi:D-glycero-D-manno-heptose 1,7-bisphosphate phosphatase